MDSLTRESGPRQNPGQALAANDCSMHRRPCAFRNLPAEEERSTRKPGEFTQPERPIPQNRARRTELLTPAPERVYANVADDLGRPNLIVEVERTARRPDARVEVTRPSDLSRRRSHEILGQQEYPP